ncbi:hypothetical protein [Arthrobacter alpinus]|uniref:hypothetical protein n=1 Tax=Arthrobacter alpinus TaxID=656366 RepID=UPI0011147CA9|nr:hypothetical protein [Arthrobacter alpinus]
MNQHRGSKGPAAVVALTVSLAISLTGSLTGCSISVPSPTAPTAENSAPATTYAPPTVVAGHDAAKVAAAPMTFEAGNTLSAGVAVGFSDVLGQPSQDYSTTPAPAEWTLVKDKVAGQTQYKNAAGCQVAYWTTVNQGPLITAGDDKASTVKLMKYLIPSVIAESLGEAKLPWVAEAGKPGPGITFLGFSTKAGKDVMASTVWGRMLGTANTSLLVSLACPTDELLAATTPAVMAKLSVAPPSS